MLSSVWRPHFHTFRFDSEHNSCTVCLFRHTHTPCTCRCTGSTAVASLTADRSVCQRFLCCFVPFLPRQQLFIIEGSNDEDGIDSSPENGCTFAHHNHLTNTSTACQASYCLPGILLLARRSTACRAFYCLPGVLLLAGHSSACWAFYCLLGILLLDGHSTACRAFYCLPGVLLLAGHSTACRAFYCLLDILLLVRRSTACRAFYCLPGIVMLAGHSTACLAFYCFSDSPSCLITYTGLALPGLRHKVFSRRRFFRYNNEFWSWIDCCCSARYGVHTFTSSVSTRSTIRAWSASSDTHTPCTCRCTGSTAVASLTANSSVCQCFLCCFVPFLPCQWLFINELFIIEGSNYENGINSSPENGHTFAHHNRLTNASTACWAFYCLLSILLLPGHSTACWAFYCLMGILLLAGHSTA